MTARNLRTRIEKLEATGRHTDETLLWRRPDEEVSSALSKASYAPGDRVMCMEWYRDGPIPEPNWYRDVCNEWSDEENRSLDIVLRKYVGKKAETEEVEPCRSSAELDRYSDSELLYFLCKAAT
jgi:hypothetical protein